MSDAITLQNGGDPMRRAYHQIDPYHPCIHFYFAASLLDRHR
jgi:hypothetical protein